ncbi:purine-nucleoside phosphorylase [Myxococcota bacterium]|nr:purine-nucleoside phosphorylase [Myxococcota bacterium]
MNASPHRPKPEFAGDPALSRVRAAAAAIAEALPLARQARIGVVLGSGLGPFAEGLEDAQALAFADVPGFPDVGVEGHHGRVVAGRTSGIPVLALQGRVHLYEGWSPRDVVLPVRALIACGVEMLLLTNAAGGIDPTFRAGDFMLVEDHLNLTGANPLRGPSEPDLGPRFPDMTRAYDAELGEAVTGAARAAGLTLRRGVYAGLGGPSYETPAEIRMLAAAGAHAVGMSTVLEVIAARHMGCRVACVSCISNAAAGSVPGALLSHDEVTATAREVAGGFVTLVTEAVSAWAALAGSATPARGEGSRGHSGVGP